MAYQTIGEYQMVISITSGSQITPEQFRQTEEFLHSFLPKLKNFPGVVHIYHYAGPDQSSGNTLIIWENEQALRVYRESELVKEAIAFEKKSGENVSRQSYPLLFSA
jgi:heme-degrading monooxygenase HmoA